MLCLRLTLAVCRGVLEEKRVASVSESPMPSYVVLYPREGVPFFVKNILMI